MIKRIITGFLCLVVGLTSAAFAGKPLVAEAPVNAYGTPVTVSIDNTTLTKLPSSQTAGRVGIYLDVPNTNTGKIVGFFGNCTSTALSSTIRPIEIAPSSNSSFIGMTDGVCLWFITTHTGPENVHYQEVKQ